jgi:hypothetical protein
MPAASTLGARHPAMPQGPSRHRSGGGRSCWGSRGLWVDRASLGVGEGGPKAKGNHELLHSMTLHREWPVSPTTRRRWQSFRWWRRFTILGGVLVGILLGAMSLALGDAPADGDLFIRTTGGQGKRTIDPPHWSPALLVFSLLKGWPLERQVFVRRRWVVRLRGRAAAAGGSLGIDAASVYWSPTKPWAELDTQQLLFSWEDVKSCEALPIGRRSVALTIHLRDGSEVGFLARDRAAVRRGLADANAPSISF